MSTYKYMEISFLPKELEKFPATDIYSMGWGRYSYADFSYLKGVAKKYLTPKQYVVFILLSKGWTQRKIAYVYKISQQAVSERKRRSVIKLRKILSEYIKNRR